MSFHSFYALSVYFTLIYVSYAEFIWSDYTGTGDWNIKHSDGGNNVMTSASSTHCYINPCLYIKAVQGSIPSSVQIEKQLYEASNYQSLSITFWYWTNAATRVEFKYCAFIFWCEGDGNEHEYVYLPVDNSKKIYTHSLSRCDGKSYTTISFRCRGDATGVSEIYIDNLRVEGITNPTPLPTQKPTAKPTPSPTNKPTPLPTYKPTSIPTASPTRNPTKFPTNIPTASPTHNPTPSPTYNPTLSPMKNPTPSPTHNPTSRPTQNPSSLPTNSPSAITTIKPMTTSSQTSSTVSTTAISSTKTLSNLCVTLILEIKQLYDLSAHDFESNGNLKSLVVNITSNYISINTNFYGFHNSFVVSYQGTSGGINANISVCVSTQQKLYVLINFMKNVTEIIAEHVKNGIVEYFANNDNVWTDDVRITAYLIPNLPHVEEGSVMDSNYTQQIDMDWIIKTKGSNCDDGYKDLTDSTSSYYGIYCQRCDENEAGTAGKCYECDSYSIPNHLRTNCDFTAPWWLYGLSGFVLISCIIVIICGKYKKSRNKASINRMNTVVIGENNDSPNTEIAIEDIKQNQSISTDVSDDEIEDMFKSGPITKDVYKSKKQHDGINAINIYNITNKQDLFDDDSDDSVDDMFGDNKINNTVTKPVTNTMDSDIGDV